MSARPSSSIWVGSLSRDAVHPRVHAPAGHKARPSSQRAAPRRQGRSRSRSGICARAVAAHLAHGAVGVEKQHLIVGTVGFFPPPSGRRAPTERCRSQTVCAICGHCSGRILPLRLLIIKKSLPAPFIFQNFMVISPFTELVCLYHNQKTRRLHPLKRISSTSPKTPRNSSGKWTKRAFALFGYFFPRWLKSRNTVDTSRMPTASEPATPTVSRPLATLSIMRPSSPRLIV